METYQHNQVKLCLGSALSAIGRRENLGLFLTDGFRIQLRGSDRFFKPDGCFLKYSSLGLMPRPWAGSTGKTNPLAQRKAARDDSQKPADGRTNPRKGGKKTGKRPAVLFTHGRRLTYTGLTGIPNVLIEVGSSSTIDLDYCVKGHEYARLGVPEFWLLLPDGPSFRMLIFHLNRRTRSYPPVKWKGHEWMRSRTFDRSFRLLCLPSIDHRFPCYELATDR